MAKVSRGSGQGRVRKEHRYTMVRCADEGCMRVVGYLFPEGTPAELPTYRCGAAPLRPRTHRVGQQRQVKTK